MAQSHMALRAIVGPPVNADAVRAASVSFPLTPALSRRERENPSPPNVVSPKWLIQSRPGIFRQPKVPKMIMTGTNRDLSVRLVVRIVVLFAVFVLFVSFSTESAFAASALPKPLADWRLELFAE